MTSFGSIFRYRDIFYVYLGQFDDVIYAARILDILQTQKLIKGTDIATKKDNKRVSENSLYSFVLLSTEEFNECAAHLYNAAQDSSISIEPYSKLNDTDINLIKKQIIEDISIPSKLQQLVKELE